MGSIEGELPETYEVFPSIVPGWTKVRRFRKGEDDFL